MNPPPRKVSIEGVSWIYALLSTWRNKVSDGKQTSSLEGEARGRLEKHPRRADVETSGQTSTGVRSSRGYQVRGERFVDKCTQLCVRHLIRHRTCVPLHCVRTRIMMDMFRGPFTYQYHAPYLR